MSDAPKSQLLLYQAPDGRTWLEVRMQVNNRKERKEHRDCGWDFSAFLAFFAVKSGSTERLEREALLP